MTNNEFDKFSELLFQIASICISSDKLSHEKVEFYFELLKDLEFEQIKQNAIYYLRTEKKPFFPSPAIFRGDTQEKAIEAYNIIQEMMNRFYSPDFHGITLGIIRERLEKSGRSSLFPLLQKWGDEISFGNNPSATRAQFLKGYNTEVKIAERKKLPSGKSQHISGVLNSITKDKELNHAD